MSDLSGPHSLRPRRPFRRTLAELAEHLGAAVPPGAPDAVVTGVTHDSRAVQPGDLYAALPGGSTHGARFADAAREAGAVACLTDPEGSSAAEQAGLPTYVVDVPRRVLGHLAAWIYGEPAGDLTTFGVTGTNGKTTTAYLLEAGLRAAGRATGLVGTIETRIADAVVPSVRTTPEATDLQALLAVMRERGVEAVAMEVSSHALAMGRVDGTTYDVAVFTNLSEDHLDFHTDVESYFQAKASLFTPERARRAVIDTDDPYGERLAGLSRAAGVPVVTVSPEGRQGADWRVVDVALAGEGSRFRLLGPSGAAVDAGTALPGAFNVDNAALAVVALVASGVDADVAAAGVQACHGVPGRMERVDVGAPFLSLVDYAHSPDALERLLVTARALVGSADGRLLVVVGCGGDRDPYKRPMMGAIAARDADIAVLTSDNPRSEDPLAILAAMREGAASVTGGGTVEVVPERREAIERAVQLARPGDVLVVAGRGHEQGQEVAGVVHPFDDRAVLREAIAAVLS
ncbi:MAG: UDP-N-acetylmuramoyl-L-alanyl-D-glutamate--2,6-diaminopimelate ligase [Actinomycetota bacterium]|nr:UDP-N-acetylmuramoyl-L-alanyl-D-glutamate--2,6-diaminopimelate ligase [Actinomycetota bacterium]